MFRPRGRIAACSPRRALAPLDGGAPVGIPDYREGVLQSIAIKWTTRSQKQRGRQEAGAGQRQSSFAIPGAAGGDGNGSERTDGEEALFALLHQFRRGSHHQRCKFAADRVGKRARRGGRIAMSTAHRLGHHAVNDA